MNLSINGKKMKDIPIACFLNLPGFNFESLHWINFEEE